MRGSGNRSGAIQIEWSPDRVRVLDPATRKLSVGATLAECFALPPAGREAIVTVGPRSSFVRGLYIPKVPRPEAARILEHQITHLLPLAAGEYVWDFRLGADAGDRGRVAVVGAIKTEWLRRIHRECETIGLHVSAVLPAVFGSWMAARRHGLSQCAVVEADGDAVSIVLIHLGELFYSRTVPTPETASTLPAEVARAFSVAEVPAGPVFSTGCPGVHVDVTYDQEPFQYLGDLGQIRSEMLSFELPEAVSARAARAVRAKATRALAAAALAIVLSAYAVLRQIPAPAETPKGADTPSALRAARAELSAAQARLAKVQTSNKILDVAFNPGQTLSDAVQSLAGHASSESWFTNLTVTRGAPASVSGLALKESDVAAFSARIAKDPRFQEMKVISSHKTTIGKKDVTQFMVIGRLRGLLAFDRPPKTPKTTKVARNP